MEQQHSATTWPKEIKAVVNKAVDTNCNDSINAKEEGVEPSSPITLWCYSVSIHNDHFGVITTTLLLLGAFMLVIVICFPNKIFLVLVLSYNSWQVFKHQKVSGVGYFYPW